jgi:Raf kinase inhibitor-like YbhB/YbcL family protein
VIQSIVVAALTATMQLSTGDFIAGGAIPHQLMATDCSGENRTPAVAWKHAPSGTKSFALIMHDPDAPMTGGFYHWVVYNIPATLHALNGNASLPSSELGTVSTGQAAYYGPCPPPGPAHHYNFTLYALDEDKVPGSHLTGPQLRAAIAGHILATAKLQGLASHP